MTTYLKALAFAKEAHKNQKRKYTHEPYVVHCIEVASILKQHGFDEDVQSAALLHDTVEDCGVTAEQLETIFSPKIKDLVLMVTDVSQKSDGNRSFRKQKDRDHVSKASYEGKSIKLADIISNVTSIVEHDKGFAMVYIKEKIALLEVLQDGHPDLLKRATEIVYAAKKELKI